MARKFGLHVPEQEDYASIPPEHTGLVGSFPSSELPELSDERKETNASKQWFEELYNQHLLEQDILTLQRVYRQTGGIPAIRPLGEFEMLVKTQKDKAPLDLLKEYYAAGLETAQQQEEWFYELDKCKVPISLDTLYGYTG